MNLEIRSRTVYDVIDTDLQGDPNLYEDGEIVHSLATEQDAIEFKERREQDDREDVDALKERIAELEAERDSG